MLPAPSSFSLPALLGRNLLLLGLLSCLPRQQPGPGKPALPLLSRPALTTPGPDLYLGRPRLLLERLDESHVRLRWNAVPETNTEGYRVERSVNGDHWTYHDFVPVNRQHRYHYDDTCRLAMYYRVVRLDLSRRLSASPGVRSTYGVPLPPLKALPNPARAIVRIQGRDPALCVEVLNWRGELVHQVFDSDFPTQGLLPGTYALRQGNQIARFIIR